MSGKNIDESSVSIAEDLDREIEDDIDKGYLPGDTHVRQSGMFSSVVNLVSEDS